MGIYHILRSALEPAVSGEYRGCEWWKGMDRISPGLGDCNFEGLAMIPNFSPWRTFCG